MDATNDNGSTNIAAAVSTAAAAPHTPAASGQTAGAATSAPAAEADRKPLNAGELAQRAIAKVNARRLEAVKGKTESAVNTGQPAPGSNAGASTGTVAATAAKSEGEQAATGGEPGDGKGGEAATAAATPGSTAAIDAPNDWPAEDRALYQKLPAEARELVLGQYKRMQGALTRANQSMAQQRAALQEMNTVMERSKASPQQVTGLLQMSADFEQNPRAVIEQLARQKGVQVFFERAQPEGEIPEFKTQAEMAKWLDDRNADRLRNQLTSEQQAAQQRQARESRLGELRNQFAEAQKLPDFEQHSEAVVEMLQRAPTLSVQEAYRLATADGLAKQAGEAQKLRGEVAALKAELENLRKKATQPARAPVGGDAKTLEAEKNLSPAQRAFQKAQRRIASRGQTLQ